jgi:hypothetical protein
MAHTKKTPIILKLHKNTWEDRNIFVHGKTTIESQTKVREAIVQKVRELYCKPSKLAARNHAISHIPIKVRLRQSTANLKDWLSRIEHQIRVTLVLQNPRLSGQLTIQEAFKKARSRYCDDNKYPP